MAGQLTNLAEKKILDHILKTASYSPPATVYLGLFSVTPGPTGGGTECAYTNYGTRPSIAFGAAASKAIANSGTVTFPQCGTTGDTAAYWGIFDAVTGGNLLAYGSLAASKGIVNGNTPSVASGQVTISFNSGVIFQAFANTVLNWLFAAGTLAQPTHVKVGLSTSTPADGTDGGGSQNITEPSGNGYAAGGVACDSWVAAAGNPEAATNTATITLGPPTGSWGTCTYGIAYLDATPAFYGTITSQSPGNGDTVEWLANQFSVSIQ